MSIPFGFTEADAKKVAQATSIVLNKPRFGPAERARGNELSQGAIVKHAVVTTACSGATASGSSAPDTPSTDGRATLYYHDGSAYQVYATGVPILNDAPGTGGAIPIGTKLKVIIQDGQWFVFWYLC
jgi:hypothetical protein